MKEKNILESYENIIPNFKNQNCRIKAVEELLKMEKEETSNEEILLLTLKHWIRGIYIKDYYKINFLIFFSFDEKFELDLLKDFNIKFKIINDEIETINDIRKMIDNKKTAFVYFNCNKLLDRQSKRAVNIGVISSGNIVGYHNNNVLLNSLAGRKKYFEVNFEQFQKSRYEAILPEDPEGKAIRIVEIGEKPNINDLIIEKLYCMSEEFLYSDNKIRKYQKKEKIYIIDGQSVYSYIKQYLFKMNHRINVMDEKSANKIFMIICSCIRKGIVSGSGTFSRNEYKSALEQFIKKTDAIELNPVISHIQVAANEWRKMARYLYQCKKYLKNKEEFINMICGQLDKIEVEETKAIKIIYEYTKEIRKKIKMNGD